MNRVLLGIVAFPMIAFLLMPGCGVARSVSGIGTEGRVSDAPIGGRWYFAEQVDEDEPFKPMPTVDLELRDDGTWRARFISPDESDPPSTVSLNLVAHGGRTYFDAKAVKGGALTEEFALGLHLLGSLEWSERSVIVHFLPRLSDEFAEGLRLSGVVVHDLKPADDGDKGGAAGRGDAITILGETIDLSGASSKQVLVGTPPQTRALLAWAAGKNLLEPQMVLTRSPLGPIAAESAGRGASEISIEDAVGRYDPWLAKRLEELNDDD